MVTILKRLASGSTHSLDRPTKKTFYPSSCSSTERVLDTWTQRCPHLMNKWIQWSNVAPTRPFFWTSFLSLYLLYFCFTSFHLFLFLFSSVSSYSPFFCLYLKHVLGALYNISPTEKSYFTGFRSVLLSIFIYLNTSEVGFNR